MKLPHRIVAFVSGVVLYNLVILVGGFLAAVAVPQAYFAWFGQNKVLALATEEAVVYALPVFVLATLWSHITVRVFPGAWRQATRWCFAGLAFAWLAWLAYSLAQFVTNPVPNQFPVGTLLLSLLVPPLWGVLNVLAAPCGVLLGGVLAREV
jgi:hypothetical protein